ncbi:16S rRNA (adenine(1518)-N(6)/adenine(1519)-N(6))-dimethyltransferase RsmA [Planctomyces sp. SH-PL62]|uniref:16S rRNA (adenine(1518)-N(6)/adenine(1519)-N(6))- dimethyltransferase RsmA n=1 Tax=Planctomyces sp. SH-PL62 TaxID=1636152 RepID=UPI00078DDE53|nr:16S rRNA (adenine(1518)-N(6)/adenine(1519)-N(6))-dimethyltransferase RsmA [Planctomyces sp. SH-PL62]AMV40700.1 Ribosomal RNA small subunit methyltransferase A [Planctomyces sp. SH-PL62]
MPTRQTQSYLRGLFRRRGLSPRHRLGQNFLIDLNIHDVIVEQAGVGPDDVVLEVGPGAGALTALMAERGARVLAVEVDPGMAELTAEAVAESPNARVLNIDALASKHLIAPEVLEALDQIREGRPYRLVANLPYNIATPLIMNLLVDDAHRPASMVVTIQKELGERMIAAPGAPDNSALSILIQALAEVEIARILPPSVFWPRPKVDSAVVVIRPVAEKREAVGDLAWFHRFVRDVFLHRRKNLRVVLSKLAPEGIAKADVDAVLESVGIDGRLRAEALEVPRWIALAQALHASWGGVLPVEAEGAEPAEEPDDG